MVGMLHNEACTHKVGGPGKVGSLGHQDLGLNFCPLLCCEENNQPFSQVSPSTPPSHSYLWPSGAPFFVPSLSLSVPVTTEPPVSLPLTSSLPVQWSWDEEHYHMDAAPLGVQQCCFS